MVRRRTPRAVRVLHRRRGGRPLACARLGRRICWGCPRPRTAAAGLPGASGYRRSSRWCSLCGLLRRLAAGRRAPSGRCGVSTRPAPRCSCSARDPGSGSPPRPAAGVLLRGEPGHQRPALAVDGFRDVVGAAADRRRADGDLRPALRRGRRHPGGAAWPRARHRTPSRHGSRRGGAHRPPAAAGAADAAPSRRAVTAFGNGAVGLLIGWLLVHAPLGVVGLAVPGLLVASTYELQTRRSAEAKLFAALAIEQQRAAGRSLEQSVAVLMTVTARMLGGADVELMLSGPEGLVRYTGDESGVSGRARVTRRRSTRPGCASCSPAASVHIASMTGGRRARSRSVPGDAPCGRRRPPAARRLRLHASRRRLRPCSGPPGRTVADADAGDADGPRPAAGSGARDRPAHPALAGADVPTRNGRSRLLDEVHALERAVAALLGSAPGGAIPSHASTARASCRHRWRPTPQPEDRGPAARKWATTGRLHVTGRLA